MNNTEAWEMVIKAAEKFAQIDETEATLNGALMMPKLKAALNRVTPRVERMRSKLDFMRAARAGKPKLPAWMAP